MRDISLGGCYHDGVAYSLAYDANGEIELSGKTFTTLDTGIDGGAKAALLKHRKNFDVNKDIPRFIVALNPVRIIDNMKNNETYGLPPGPQLENDCMSDDLDDCDSCGIYNRVVGSKLCHNCLDDYCSECEEYVDDCECFDSDIYCEECDELEEDYECWDVDNFVYEESVSETPKSMNAFDRARWNKTNSE